MKRNLCNLFSISLQYLCNPCLLSRKKGSPEALSNIIKLATLSTTTTPSLFPTDESNLWIHCRYLIFYKISHASSAQIKTFMIEFKPRGATSPTPFNPLTYSESHWGAAFARFDKPSRHPIFFRRTNCFILQPLTLPQLSKSNNTPAWPP